MKLAHVEIQSSRTVHVLVSINTNEGITPLVQRAFQTDHDELERPRGVRPDVVRDFGDVGVIERSVDFIQHEER